MDNWCISLGKMIYFFILIDIPKMNNKLMNDLRLWVGTVHKKSPSYVYGMIFPTNISFMVDNFRLINIYLQIKYNILALNWRQEWYELTGYKKIEVL